MPWRLIGFILCIVFVTVFIGFNLDNSCNISFGFYELKDVPIFFSLLASFLLGVLVVLPFTLVKKHSKKSKQNKDKTSTVVATQKNVAASTSVTDEKK